jgi:hypothetical protein
MVTIKREKIERAQNFARVMREVTMLGSFIRLADYLFVECESRGGCGVTGSLALKAACVPGCGWPAAILTGASCGGVWLAGAAELHDRGLTPF